MIKDSLAKSFDLVEKFGNLGAGMLVNVFRYKLVRGNRDFLK
jgi:hypothetical protein